MIEPMPDKASEGGTDIQSLSDKMNEVISVTNRLEELARLGLGADEKKGGLRMGPGITRRPKEKGE